MDDQTLLDRWDMTTNFEERDQLLQLMRERHLFPEGAQTAWEEASGAYPTIDDPNFLMKLLERREFAESYQDGSMGSKEDPCKKSEDSLGFELSPVQRFVANFMSARTPYKSMLLYHGVGVGKTCSAIQIAEQWLHFNPDKQVIILAPKTVHPNFYKNIFDFSKIKFGKNPNEPNTTDQCTGTIYLELTNTLYERNKDIIIKKIKEKRKQRYEILGYGKFANRLKNILLDIPERYTGEERRERERQELQEYLEGKLIIIDEVHNLRDNPEEPILEEVSSVADDDVEEEKQSSEEKAGKQLTPYLERVLRYVDGLKLVMMTATPMFNSYKEIIFLLNLILLNEKKGGLSESDIFYQDGTFREGGEELLGSIAQRYISYMRGENPDIFPLRLSPSDTLKTYPTINPRGMRLSASDRSYIEHFPIVPVPLHGDLLEVQTQLINELPQADADTISALRLKSIIEKGLFIVPPVTEEQVAAGQNNNVVTDIMERVDINALNLHFHRQVVGGEIMWKGRGRGRASWLAADKLEEYSPKISKILKSVQGSEGVCFIYSRFVRMGCIPIALALEANGYTCYGRRLPVLGDGIQAPGGRQCALCPSKEDDHEGANHQFTPAYYCILTGDAKLSPNNQIPIAAAVTDDNVAGAQIKAIIGSPVASEGVDFKFIREIHILEPWYHLNRIEQIIGRGIRTGSHCMLQPEKRNCTVFMYACTMPNSNRETGDLFSYRKAYKKARLIGGVSRILKAYAVDCNLNHDAIIIKGREKRTIVNSQGEIITDVSVDDKPNTSICDWLDTCDYQCIPQIDVDVIDASEVSYDEFTARWYDARMKRDLRAIFQQPGMVIIPYEAIATLLGKYPRVARLALLKNVTNNPSFVVRNNGRDGYIIYRNGYYLFQPFLLKDLRIPRAIRISAFPERRDYYSPEFMNSIGEQVIAEDEEEDEDSAVEAPIEPSFIKQILRAIRSWSQELMTKNVEVPTDIMTWLSGQKEFDKKDLTRYQNRLQMVIWMAESMRLARIKPEVFEQILMEFFFDEFMNEHERFTFYEHSELSELGSELSPIQYNQYSKKNMAYVFVSTETGQLTYLCNPDKTECSPAIIDLINEKSEYNKFFVDDVNTGFFYGFMIPKSNGTYTFKTNTPLKHGSKDALDRKLPTGKECAIVSNSSLHIRNAIALGEFLKAKGLSDLSLTDQVLDKSDRKPKNTQQICTINNLVLRYMDIIKVDGKRWFYRPIDAALTGHKGRF